MDNRPDMCFTWSEGQGAYHREKMVSYIFFISLFFIICNFSLFVFIVCAVSGNKIHVRVSGSMWCDKMPEMHQGEAGVPLGEGEAGEHRGKGDKEKSGDRCGEQG
jgi:hypothetical protein